jgi:hypothetical protein
MDAADLLPHRTALIGVAVAMTLGLTGGMILKMGPQTAPEMDAYVSGHGQDTDIQPIAWPTGKVADYVIGTDFVLPKQGYPPPVVVASYEVPEYAPMTSEPPSSEAEMPAQPVRYVPSDDRAWPSTHGDILDTRLPEDAPAPREVAEAPRPPEAPVAIAAPVAMAAAY